MIRLRLSHLLAVVFIAAIAFLQPIPSFAHIKLPALVRDSMILQRDAPLRIWGWAAPGEKVTVKFLQQTKKTTTSATGEWAVVLAPVAAGGPYTFEVSGQNKITISEVLVGDVWFCSGQSNMVHQMGIHRDLYEQEIQTANAPTIRHFWIPTATSITGPKADLPKGYWKAATPQNLPEFSAVAYFFAKKIQASQHIPIGLINASVGGTPIQAWISEQGLGGFADLVSQIEKNKDTSNSASGRDNFTPQKQPVDKGMAANLKWYNEQYRPVNWRNITVPGYWEDQGANNLNGIVWYRREITVPAAWANNAVKLVLGRIVDADEVYINGTAVGRTTYLYPQRRYQLPAGTLRAGKNTIVVRVTNNSGKGGFVPDKPYALVSGTDSLDLKGTWQYKVGTVFAPPAARGGGGNGGGTTNPQNAPAALYNAMVAGAINYGIKGVLWYQGESNVGQPELYATLMKAIITDWRSKFKQPNLPFLFVQLPTLGDISYLPSESGWAEMREAQAGALTLPNTAMAVAIDLGEWNDIHPNRKKEVGDRLALLALKKVYGQPIVAVSPMIQSAMLHASKVVISFNTDGSSLQSLDGEALNTFAIAGADKKFVWAQANIENGKVMVWSNDVPEPRYVRYAWADSPDFPNLGNEEGLPAAPFQIDVRP